MNNVTTAIVEQECNCCGTTFRVQYCENGSYGSYIYIDEPCNCECDFSPVDGAPSISEWIKRKEA